MTTRFSRIAAVLALALCHATAHGQAYPSKPVRMVNPFQAGGAGEIVFRGLLPALEQKLGQKLILESRTGAGGNVGAQAVAASAPDGYTLLLAATNNLVVNQFVFAGMSFDPLKAFAPITILAEVPSVFYTNPQVPAKSLQEFVAHAKANAGKVNYSSPGNGTTPHLNVELLAQLAGIRLVHVPYRGLPDALAAVVANDVQLYLAGLAAGRGQLQAGKLRAIAVGSRERLPALPDVPTLIESGFRDFEASNWFALVAPAGTDNVILERWATDVRFAVTQADAQKRFAETGLVAGGMPIAEFRTRLAREARLWEGVVKAAGIKAE